MKISEIIKELNEVIEVFGDFEVSEQYNLDSILSGLKAQINLGEVLYEDIEWFQVLGAETMSDRGMWIHDDHIKKVLAEINPKILQALSEEEDIDLFAELECGKGASCYLDDFEEDEVNDALVKVINSHLIAQTRFWTEYMKNCCGYLYHAKQYNKSYDCNETRVLKRLEDLLKAKKDIGVFIKGV